jgi:hypothetical protein
MRALSTYTQQILAQNAGRDFDRLTLKLALLRKDPFAFFRGTNPLFLEFLPRAHSLLRAPCILVCGDLHLENFGAFKGDNRLCYFDLNDFDEACLAPFTIDIVRFVASIKVAGHGLGLNSAQVKTLVQHFFKAYLHSIRDGKPRWVERSLAQGVFRALLRRAMGRTRRSSRSRVLGDLAGLRSHPPMAGLGRSAGKPRGSAYASRLVGLLQGLRFRRRHGGHHQPQGAVMGACRGCAATRFIHARISG